MGKRGPLAAKGLTRRKSRQKALDAAITVGSIKVDVEAPYEPDERWHPIATTLYEAVQHSGQAEFYAESDWTKLYLLCDQLSANLQPQFVGFAKQAEVVMVNGKEEIVFNQKPIAGTVPMNGATLNAIQAVMTSLGISEGDRRRMNMELRKGGAEDGEDAAAKAAREEAALMESMRTGGNVVPFDRASNDS